MDKSNQDTFGASVLLGMQRSGVCALLALVVAAFVDPTAMATLLSFLSTPLPFLCWLGIASGASLILLQTSFNVVSFCSPAFAARLLACSLLFADVLGVGLGNGSWKTLLAYVVHLSALGTRNRDRLEEAALTGTFSRVPTHVVGMQALWDQGRLTFAAVIWRFMTLLEALFTRMLPLELRVYACEVPIFRLGDDVEFGIAAYFSPLKNAKKRPKTPEYFVCNVGHLSHSASGAMMRDIQITNNTLREVWQEFKDPNLEGLVANVVAVFPACRDQDEAKEVNLSVWESEEAAGKWYRESKAHKRVLMQHNSGALQTFGNLLASLKPSRPIRQQDRCQRCGRVVEASEPGLPPPRRCGICGGSTYGYPVF